MVNLVGVLVALAVLAFVVRQVVTGRIRVRYAALWLLVSAVVAVVAVIPGLLAALAGALGFAVPANLLFFAGVVFLLVVTIGHSAAVTRLEDRVQRLAEEVSLLNEAHDRSGDAPRPGTARGDAAPGRARP